MKTKLISVVKTILIYLIPCATIHFSFWFLNCLRLAKLTSFITMEMSSWLMEIRLFYGILMLAGIFGGFLCVEMFKEDQK